MRLLRLLGLLTGAAVALASAGALDGALRRAGASIASTFTSVAGAAFGSTAAFIVPAAAVLTALAVPLVTAATGEAVAAHGRSARTSLVVAGVVFGLAALWASGNLAPLLCCLAIGAAVCLPRRAASLLVAGIAGAVGARFCVSLLHGGVLTGPPARVFAQAAGVPLTVATWTIAALVGLAVLASTRHAISGN